MTDTDHATRTVAPTLAHLAVPISALRPHPRNPRRGDLEAVKDSLRHHGQYRPVVANRRTGEVLAGNHVLRAASELGFHELAATFVDLSDEEAIKLVLVDNRTSDLAGYDDALLLELLEGLGDLSGTGFDEAALVELLDEVAPPPYEDEDLPPAPREPETRPGDLCGLGDHRLLCGDATDRNDLERLMIGYEAALLWTDPPYGVAYEGKTAARLRLRNDRPEGLEALLQKAFAAIDGVLSPGAALYVAHPAGAQSTTSSRRSRRRPGRCARRSCGSRTRSSWATPTTTSATSRSSTVSSPAPAASAEAVKGGTAMTPSRASSRSRVRAPPASTQRSSRSSSWRSPCATRAAAVTWSSTRSPARARRWSPQSAGAGGRTSLEVDPAYCDVICARWERLAGRAAELLERHG